MTWYTLIIQYTIWLTILSMLLRVEYLLVLLGLQGLPRAFLFGFEQLSFRLRPGATSRTAAPDLRCLNLDNHLWGDRRDVIVRKSGFVTTRDRLWSRRITTLHLNLHPKSAKFICCINDVTSATIDSPESRNLQSLCWYRFVCLLTKDHGSWLKMKRTQLRCFVKGAFTAEKFV